MPPLMITKVMPMAMIPRNDADTAMFAKLAVLKNCVPNAMVPPITTSNSTTGAAARWTAEANDPYRAFGFWPASLPPSMVMTAPAERSSFTSVALAGCTPRRG
jgi:hypothetical protein